MTPRILPCLVVLLLFSVAFSLKAQTGARHFSNFETQHGVVIQPQAAPSPFDTKTRSLVRAKTFGLRRPKSVKMIFSGLRPTALLAEPSRQTLGAFTTGNTQTDRLIIEAGNRNGVDPALLYAIMHQESSFKPHVVSPKGACGLMQLIRPTALRFGVRNIFDPRENIEGGARYMRFLLNFFDDNVSLALAGYNAGEGAVLKYGRRIPPYRETEEYVRRITRRYALLRAPEAARAARPAAGVLASGHTALQEEKPPTPLTIYERDVFAVRQTDGKLHLISQ